MAEEWRAVLGYEGLYEVSSLGRVRRLAREVVAPYRGGFRVRRLQAAFLKPHIRADNGRPQVDLYGQSGRKSRRVHQLVAEAFCGPRPDGMEACHNDGDRLNNRADNLRWDTHAANAQDILRHGTHVFAGRTHCSRDHPYTDENTYHPPSAPTHRVCRACARERRTAA